MEPASEALGTGGAATPSPELARAGLGDWQAAAETLALCRSGQHARAWRRARAGRGPVASVLALALEEKARGRSGPALRDVVRAAALERIGALGGWLRPLEVVAALAPLLGLLGAVLGMIGAFAALEAAGSRVDPAVLAGAIWEALLTTALGLGVAIPTVAALAWFERRIERMEREMDTAPRALRYPRSPRPGRFLASHPSSDTSSALNKPSGVSQRTLGRGKPLRPGNGGRRRRALVSLTAPIDVVFILLVFLMLASSLLDWSGIPLATARAGADPAGLAGAVPAEVRSDGLRLSGEAVGEGELAPRIRAPFDRRPAIRVLGRPEPGVAMQRVVAVLDRLSMAGAGDIALLEGRG